MDKRTLPREALSLKTFIMNGLIVLEEQVGRLEQKHESLTEKVDNQFNQVGDQLRQILQCVQPRHREQGDTPPPVKHHRAA